MSDDKKLVEEFLRSRNEASFRQLYRAHCGLLYRLAMNLCRYNEFRAGDLMQETWLRAVQQLPRFEWQCRLSTWLCGILINCNKELTRKESRSFTDELTDIHPVTEIKSSVDINKALQKLPDGYREVILLHDLEGYKHHEIGGILGISAGTSKSQLYHARKAIRELLN